MGDPFFSITEFLSVDMLFDVQELEVYFIVNLSEAGWFTNYCSFILNRGVVRHCLILG